MKVCRACGESKALSEFHKKLDGHTARCKSCTSAARRGKHPPPKDRALAVQRTLASFMKRKYGITFDQYNQMLAAQGGVCAICGEACITGKRLAVDHCHTTGAVRALLCSNCNTGLGKFRDNPDLLRAAALYLEKHACQQSP